MIWLLCTLSLSAQVTISGNVTDKSKKPLASVSVMLKKKNGIVLAFAISNAGGKYRIQYASIPANDTLLLEANAIGYKKIQVPLTQFLQPVDFAMEATSNRLPDVKVQNNRQMLKREGDTLNYDVASFSDKQDRTIGDVIKKLPGVEVGENGEISVGGKPINRLYIDGDNLLDGKYNIATRNIPTDAVAKVQVLENHQPIKVLKDAVKSESAAMNLVLKDKARVKLMGAGDLSAGPPDLYNTSVNAMLFQKRVKFINNTRLNNTGFDLGDDILNHFTPDNQPPPQLLNAGAGGTPPLLKKRYLFNNAGLINANDLINLRNEYQLRVNASYLFDRQYQQSGYTSAYFLPNDTIRYAESQDGRKALKAISTQFTLTANKKNYFLNNVTTIENTGSDVNAALAATTNSHIEQQLSGTVTNLSNKFTIIKRSERGTVYEASSFINSIRNPATLSVEPGLYANQFNNGNPFASLVQYASVPTFFTDNYVSFGKTKARFQQQYRVGASFQDQQVQSELSTVQLSGTTAAAADSFINRLNWQRWKIYVQPDLTYTSDKTMLRFSLPVTSQDTRYSGRLSRYANNDILFTPRAYFKYLTGKEDYITLTYTYANSQATIDQVYDAYLMRNYRDFFANGELFGQVQRHSVAGAYFFRNTLKIFFFTVGGAYNSNNNNTISDTRISSVVQQSKLIPFFNLSGNTQLYGNISKYIFPLLTTVGARFSWNRADVNQLLNSELLKMKTDIYNAALSLNTKFSKFLTVSYSGSYTASNSIQQNVKYAGQVPSQSVNRWQHEVTAALNFSDNFFGKLNMEHYLYQISGSQNNQYTFADASFTWKLDKLKTDIEFSLTNLGNIDTYSTAFLTANSITESNYRIRPRMGMIKFYFRF